MVTVSPGARRQQRSKSIGRVQDLAAAPVVSHAVESQNTSAGVGSGTDCVSLSVYVYTLVLGLELGPSIY